MTRVGLSTATSGPRQPGEPPPSRPKRRPGWRLVAPALAATAVGGLVALGQTTLVRALDGMLPDAGRITSFNRPGTITILSSDGQVVLKKGPATREKLPAGKMPLLIQRAFVAAEDATPTRARAKEVRRFPVDSPAPRGAPRAVRAKAGVRFRLPPPPLPRVGGTLS